MQDVYQDEIKSCNICKKIVLRVSFWGQNKTGRQLIID